MRGCKPTDQFDKSQTIKCCEWLNPKDKELQYETLKIDIHRPETKIRPKAKMINVTVSKGYRDQKINFVKCKAKEQISICDNQSVSESIKKRFNDGHSDCPTVLDSNHKFCQPSQADSTVSEEGPKLYQGSRTLSFLFESTNTQL